MTGSATGLTRSDRTNVSLRRVACAGNLRVAGLSCPADADCTTAVLGEIEPADCGFRFQVTAHLDISAPCTHAAARILGDARAMHRTELAEHDQQILVGSRPWNVSDVEFRHQLRLVDVANRDKEAGGENARNLDSRRNACAQYTPGTRSDLDKSHGQRLVREAVTANVDLFPLLTRHVLTQSTCLSVATLRLEPLCRTQVR